MDTRYIESRLREAGDHWTAGEHEKARAAFEECIADDHLSEESSTKEIEEALVVLNSWMGYGAFLLDIGHPEEAVVAATRGMAFGHFLGSGNELLAACYSELKDHEKAVTALQDALKRRPSPVSWVLLYGELRCLGRNEEAQQCLHRALDLDQDYEEAHYNLGCSAVYEKDWELAERHYRRALECDPEYAAAHAQLGWALMQLHRRQGGSRAKGLDEAETHLRLAVSFDADYYWARIYLGNLCWQRENLKEAEIHFKRSIELLPDCYEPHLYYGELLCFGLRKFRLGEHHLRLALALNPENAVTHYNYGKFLYGQRRHEQAKEELQLAHRLGEDKAVPYLEDYG